jgi:[ribosomal protein S18]-alanine N-acetyltransferase
VTEAVLERIEARGFRSVSVTVHPDNGAALGLYRALGFEQERSEPDYFGEGKPRVVLRGAGRGVRQGPR